jgi:hypothetical protein
MSSVTRSAQVSQSPGSRVSRRPRSERSSSWVAPPVTPLVALPIALLATVLLTIFGLCSGAGSALARDTVTENPLLRPRSSQPAGEEGFFPSQPAGARSDTIDFGFYAPNTGMAVQGETWTFDHGAPDSLEGWTPSIFTIPQPHWRRISAADWAGHQNQVAAPIITGQGSAWAGLQEDQADSVGYVDGLGYGNDWDQVWISPALTYTGSGSVNLSLRYFNDTEQDYDYTRVLIEFAPDQHTTLNGDGFTGRIGDPSSGNYPTYTRVIGPTVFGSHRQFRIAVEMVSDGGWSDEDGEYPTLYGPCAFDDIALSGSIVEGGQLYGFEEGNDGFTAVDWRIRPSQLGVAEASDYLLPDPYECGPLGKLLEFHDATWHHPADQDELILSPVVDRASLGPYYNRVMVEYDLYARLAGNQGVEFRTAWSYYPYNGQTGWSPIMYDQSYLALDGGCMHLRRLASDADVPSDAQLYRLGFRLATYNCDPLPCEPNNFTPLLDNIRVRVTHVPEAPLIAFSPGCRFQDAFPTADQLASNATANADVSYNLYYGNANLPDRLGDSLVVTGPTPGAGTSWEAKLHFRVSREGPAQRTIAGYNTWLSRVADGRNIVGRQAPFTVALMDSVETASTVFRNRFCSQFREDDDDFAVGHEQDEENEIIPDGILTPGTKIEYFVTANFTCTPAESYVLPDTSGGRLAEFEVLPSYRTSGGRTRFPCLLYVEASGGTNRQYTEGALNVAINGAAVGDTIPDLTTWDRYDYLYAGANYKGALVRTPGSTSGATVGQLLAYRAILLDTGDLGAGTTAPEDWSGFGQWLNTTDCQGNQRRQGLDLRGDQIGAIADNYDPAFLQTYGGASLVCNAYHDLNCPPGEPPQNNDTQHCVRLIPAGGSGAPDNLDLWGNGGAAFNVLAPSGTGVGSMLYRKIDTVSPVDVPFAQILNDGVPGNYGLVLDAFSAHHLTLRDEDAQGPDSECPNDYVSIVAANAQEVGSSIGWMLHLPDPRALGLCSDPCADIASDLPEPPAPATGVFSLDQNRPNPFSRNTAIRFSLGQSGQAEVAIFDAGGRRVRTLVRQVMAAGPHEIVWDGKDDLGRSLSAGIYWSQLRFPDYRSSRKILLLQ